MSIATSGNLIDVLRDNNLVSRDRLTELVRTSGRSAEARPLLKILVQRGWLTVFQMNQILLGRAKQLAVGPYQILDRLGQGGLSSVYRARHSVHEWEVALKIIRPDTIANTHGRKQFLAEIEAMARLDHPNIVQFCDTDEVGDTFYYAMEYVEGTDLGKYVGLTGLLPIAEACDYVRQTALGLQHAHERNLVHRDIKPVNLYLTHVQTSKPAKEPAAHRPFEKPPEQVKTPPQKPQPIVKILDWGLASLRNPRGASGSELIEHLAKGVIGTADYISPEQARCAQAVDVRGDIYSLGCTFYYLLTGQPPFPDGTAMQKLLQHQNEDPEPVQSFREDLPLEVGLILKRMMAKMPERRFQTPAGVALALLPFTREHNLATVPLALPRFKKATPGKSSVSDATPLPINLGGVPGVTALRTCKAGARKAEADTSTP